MIDIHFNPHLILRTRSFIARLKRGIVFFFKAETVQNQIDNLPYEIMGSELKVMGRRDSLLYMIKSKCAVSRFGDGEFRLSQIGHGCPGFQGEDIILTKRLSEILSSPFPENVRVAIPDIFSSLSQYNERAKECFRYTMCKERNFLESILSKNVFYLDAMISRCYIDIADRSTCREYFDLFRELWKDRDVIIIEGKDTKFGIGNDLLLGCKRIRRVICPSKNAFLKYKQIFVTAKMFEKDCLFLIALGPTATVLAYDLGKEGIQAIDIGHLDIEYEWFLRGATKKIPIVGKYVNEAGGMSDKKIFSEVYKQQVVKEVL